MDLIVFGITVGCIFSIIALGFSIIFRGIKLVNIAHGGLVVFGSLIGYTFVKTFQFPYLLGLVLSMVSGAIVAILLDRLFFSPTYKLDVSSARVVFATVGAWMVLENGSKLIWGSSPLIYPTYKSFVLNIGSIRIGSQYLWVIISAIGVMIALYIFLFYSIYGKALRAYADNRVTAELMGIKGRNVAVITMGISGALGAAGGVMFGQIYYGSYELGMYGINGLTAAILGGFGSIPGAVVGGILLGLIESLVTGFISSDYRNAITFTLLIIILLIKPSGILGRDEIVKL